jgi:hypothetical protein
MNLRNSFILSIICLFLSGCKNPINFVDEPLDSSYITMQRIDPVCGEWTYSFPFYSSSLSIKEDNTFTFFNQRCIGRGYTEGKWIRKKGYLVLMSYDWYKQTIHNSDTSNLYFNSSIFEIKDNALVDISDGKSDAAIDLKSKYH